MSNIEWCDETLNVSIGCSRVSAGCENCYAERMAHRGLAIQHKGTTISSLVGPRWNGTINLVPKMLEKPLRWQRPKRIFINSMSDLFHEGIDDDYLDRVFAMMAVCGGRRFRCFRRECDHEGFDCETNGASPILQPIHTFQVLTKRAERMRSYLSDPSVQKRILDASQVYGWTWPPDVAKDAGWPLHNVEIGVSCENQETAVERIPYLLDTPAAVRFVSLEPLLSGIELDWIPANLQPLPGKDPTDWFNPLNGDGHSPPGDGIPEPGVYPTLDLVIVGGESGPGARPCDVEWIRSIVEQCKAAAVPCFVKQLGAKPFGTDLDLTHGRFACAIGNEKPRYLMGRNWLKLKNRKGADMAEWPVDLRVQQLPGEVRDVP